MIRIKLFCIVLFVLLLPTCNLFALEYVTLWEGPVVLSDETTNRVPIPIDTFSGIKAGDILQLGISDLKIGAGVTLYYASSSGWTVLPDTRVSASLQGDCLRYTVTEAMAEVLHGGSGAEKVYVLGINFTLEDVCIVDPASIIPLNVEVSHQVENMVFYDCMPELTLTYNYPSEALDSTVFDVKVYNDRRMLVGQNSVEATAGTATIEMPTGNGGAGIYIYELYANSEFVESYNFAVNPLEINPGTDAQPDFADFWAAAKAQLASIDMDVKMTLLEDVSTAARSIYLVEMKSVPDGPEGEPVVIKGYYAEPNAEGTFPAVIIFQGYDTQGDSSIMDANSRPDFAELRVSTRGQSLNWLPGDQNIYGEPMIFNLADKDSYYYRGAYMDALRSIDFIASREKVQKNNIFAAGGSQGGALTMVAAALGDGRIKAAAPSITFLGDFPNNFETSSWPGSVFRRGQSACGLSDEEMFTMLSYFDIKNFAPSVTCPVYVSISLQDKACHPCTTFAIYNNISSAEKDYVINPLLGHAVASNWYGEWLQFIKSKVTDPAEEEEEEPEPEPEPCDAPVISISGLTVKVSSSIPDAVYHTEINPVDKILVEHAENEDIDLSGQYIITSYATAPGYSAGPETKAILLWTGDAGAEDPTEVKIIGTSRPVIVYNLGNHLMVDGLQNSEKIELYLQDGTFLWSGVSNDTRMMIPMVLDEGGVYLVKVGGRTLKYRL